MQQVEGEKGSTAEEELQELTLLLLGGVVPAVFSLAGKHEDDFSSSPHAVPQGSHSMMGLFPDISVSPRKCCHKPLYRSTKQTGAKSKGTMTNIDCLLSLQPH